MRPLCAMAMTGVAGGERGGKQASGAVMTVDKSSRVTVRCYTSVKLYNGRNEYGPVRFHAMNRAPAAQACLYARGERGDLSPRQKLCSHLHHGQCR